MIIRKLYTINVNGIVLQKRRQHAPRLR